MKAKRARGTGSLFKRPRSPHWWISFHHNGRLLRESSHSTLKTVAQAMLTDRLDKVNKHTFQPKTNKTTVDDIVQLVFDEYEANKRPTLSTLRGRYHTDKAGKNRKGKRTTLKIFFGHLPCHQVDYDLLDEYQKLRQKEGAANGSINRELNILKTAWKYALRKKRVLTRPEFPKNLSENIRKGFIKDADYMGFVNACMSVKGGGLWMRTAFEIAYTYGFRKREITSLRLSNLNMHEREIRLEADQTKTKKAKTVPMTDLVFTLISECIKGKTNPNDYVLTRNGKPIKYFWNSWKKVTELAGRPGTLFHDLRRSAVSVMVKTGVPRKVAMSISGHETESIFSRYHITETEDQKEAINKVITKRAENLDKTHIDHTASLNPQILQ